MHPVEAYIREIVEIRRSGAAVPETSYYGPLATLFNEVGRNLSPKVRCIINISNKGAGIPDAGLFTPDQFQRRGTSEPLPGQLPARGVMEVKPPSTNVTAIAAGEQVERYFGTYRQILVTNLWDFLLVGRDASGLKTNLERFHLAENEKDFWEKAAHPRSLAAEVGDRLVEYLRRVMLQATELASPQEIAWILASYAREAMSRVETHDRETPALRSVKESLEEALGIHFEGEKGEHFFRSTLVQTLFYGVFSAWVLWARERPASDVYSRFDWRSAPWTMHVPMISALFSQVATPSRLGPLALVEVLDWTASVLNRVRRDEFFSRFEESHAVQYFYEPFLQAFDPELRKALGVWFTPPEIVRYMVARVDRVLRDELGVADGLASEQVYVLDPCCGTGAYLVEVLSKITETLRETRGDALLAQDIKRAAMERVFGFEILPAPYVVSHLQLGMLLQRLGAAFKIDPVERAAVYLTNALTGWESPEGEQPISIPIPELQEEHDAAERVKQKKPILVILGNPPYNAFAGVSPKEEKGKEKGLVEPYKEGLIAEWGIKKFNLDDLYVRFFRLAERRIAEMTGKGVVCFISNFSYISDPSFVVMRQRLLSGFDTVWFDSLNGDSRQTGKLTPEGSPDPSIFSTKFNKEGIRVGTAVGLLVKKEQSVDRPTVRWRQFWGVEKAEQLLASLDAEHFNDGYEPASPTPENRYSFRPIQVAKKYLEWPKVTELCAVPPSNGLMEKRGGALMDIDRSVLERRMRRYYDQKISWEELKALRTGLTTDAARFDAQKARIKVLGREKFKEPRLLKYSLRPFDSRWAYYSPTRPLWNEPRPQLWKQYWDGNEFFMTRPKGVAKPEGAPFYFTQALGDNDFLRGHAYYFPIRLKNHKSDQRDQHTLASQTDTHPPHANVSTTTRAYLSDLGIPDPDKDSAAALVWLHCLAVGFSPSYLTENAGGLAGDWPRIPLPTDKNLLLTSAGLGRQIADLLDVDTPLQGVTCGDIRSELRPVGLISSADETSLDPDSGHLDLTAGWGHFGQKTVVMPGKGKRDERSYSDKETRSLREGITRLGLDWDNTLGTLGESTYDVWLNDVAYWRNIPSEVWNYYIGGYQVLKKWLSYREKVILGRGLTMDEVRLFTDMARRLTALRLMEPALDESYAAIKACSYSWPKK